MTRSSRLLFPALLLLVSCSKHPLHGGWREEGAKAPRVLSFDPAGSKLMVHTPPRPDGGHDHLHGTYTFDAATKAVTVQCKLLGDGKADRWSGTLADKALELSSADGKLAFARGGSAH